VKRFSRSWRSLALLGAIACGGRAPARAQAPAPGAAAQDPSLPPVGFGSLRQDEVGILIGTDQLRIRILPLDEHIIRLLATDAYRSLHDMAASRAADIQRVARTRGFDSTAVFMVTFFGMAPQARFNPDDLTITSQGTTFRAIGYVPFTPRFSDNLLGQREQAAAIYVFEPGLAVLRPFTVSYGVIDSDAWSGTLETINAERGRVLSRASSTPQRP
jgi:hypothetical protein